MADDHGWVGLGQERLGGHLRHGAYICYVSGSRLGFPAGLGRARLVWVNASSHPKGITHPARAFPCSKSLLSFWHAQV